MDEVMCYRCGSKMRPIKRLGVYFCDNDGYIMSFKDALTNRLVVPEPVQNSAHH